MKIQTLLCAGLLLALLGCSKLTLESYNQIKVGMSFEEVTQLIGAPDSCDDVMGLRSCTWGDEQRYVKVSFAGSKVLVFSSSNLK